ncbi:hypothetical protein QN277_010520 [Acacia crassicarpa]|uniref:NB-ARC domain-containing protein n=1 Tax=Acacia crassicarpa TaxID=499986 RepID=A0AAE1IR05_9FABA|nr:hypothetical protein QN277_010520 [Acacia crassicarpa]
MESCLLDLAKNEVQSLVNLVKNEAQYLCCFNSYVENFEQKKNILAAKHKDVKRKFQKGKGVFSFKSEAQQWEREADDIIHIDTKIKKNLFFGWCPNCWSQYRIGKKLAEKTQHIEKLLERCNSNIVTGQANVLDVKYLSSQGFIHFDSRESKFQDLLKALLDENCNMIGLQGLGGTGKTSMAKEVGHKLKESKSIDKFIFLVVSQAPDFKKICGELAKSLDLNLDEVKEEEHSSTILSRITNMDQKLLIILDDVWVKFDLTEKLGIPFGHQQKGCNLLITTRSSRVSIEMGCQTIQLHILTDKEALNLFEAHTSLNNSSRGFKGMPQKIVKHCRGVPIAIVALARALKNEPVSVWKDALKTLEDGGLDQNLEEAYKCLKLSYDNLKSQKAKELLLIYSLFPEDSEIPVNLLIKTGIGLGSFNENDKYHLIRSEVHVAIMELIHSSLLLNDEKECVKMHDLVREVALRIGDKDMQSLLDLEKPIKGNLRYLFWKTDKLFDEIDGNKLEFLSIWLDDSKGFNVTDTFFKKMTSIKVLILAPDENDPALPLMMNSLLPLKSVQTLILANLELGDISVLGNLLTLVTLWFSDCLIVELPKEFLKLKKLRSLEVEKCKIKRNNPFEVIEMCSKLEELTFVGNVCENEGKDAISHNGSPLTLHRYCISYEDDLSDYFEKYGSMSRCFLADELSNLVSHATFKQLVERAEILSLKGEVRQRMWKNLVPDIFPIDKQGVMNDLIVLHLSSRPNMEYLIDTKDHDPSMSAFCNLAELHLSEMGVEDLCRGPPPSGFLEQLEMLKLTMCSELKSILFNANYNLCHLESMELEDCPKLMSVFQPYTARSLKQLKKLTIKNCTALEYIIVGEDGDSNQKNYESFPSLEALKLSGVPNFIGIVRKYHQLMSSSMHKPSPLLSRHNSNDINHSLATRAFSWVQACCSFNKLRPANKETNVSIFEDRSLDHTNPLELLASKKWIDTAPTIVRQLVLQVCHIRKMELAGLSLNSVSKLFTLSMASMISWEELKITKFDELKHLVTSEDDDYKELISCHSIFPKLKNLEIRECKDLEILFLPSISIEIKNLMSLTIRNAPKLTYVVGKYQHHHFISNQNQNDELHFNLPALEALSFEDVPEFMNIGHMNFIMVSLSLQNVCSYEGQLKSNTTKEVDASTTGAPLFHVTQNLLKNIRKINLVGCRNLISLTTLSIASIILLEVLTIRACGPLKCIVGDEGDARSQINYNSIFPKLKRLEVSDCDALEYLFPAYAFRSPVYLESLKISKAPMLKFAFGRSQRDDSLNPENQNMQTLIDFPALKYLSIEDVPKLVSIYPESYYMRRLYLRSVSLKELPKITMRPFNEFSVCWHTDRHETKVIEMCQKTLEFLQVCDFKMKEIFDLTYMEREKKGDELQPLTSSLRSLKLLNLSELVNICVGPKCIIRFDSLRSLTIKACKKLRVIFSASIVRSLPVLWNLHISECEELVHIVEEDYETNADDHVRHERCFPNLESVSVSDCDKLKYLFSITISGILPQLDYLQIKNAYELEHVLIRRDEMEEIVMKDVLPQLTELSLLDLPNLISVCHGINFQKEDYSTFVDNCPKFGTSTIQHQANLESGNSQVEEKAEERLSSHMEEEITQQSFTKGATKEIVEEDLMSEFAKMEISSSNSKLVVEARAKGVSPNTLYEISPTPEKEVPIHTSLSLTALPTRDNTHACARILEGEEEEEEQGCLITSRRLQSGIMASSSLLEDKLETSIDAVTSIVSELTSKAILSSKASTSLNQAPSLLSKSSDDDDVQVYDKSHPHSTNLFEGVDHGDIKEEGMVQSEYKSNVEPSSLTRREQESSYSKGQIQTKDQLTCSQPRSAMSTTSFDTISQDEYSEIVEVRGEEGALILETPHPSFLTSKEESIPVSLNSTFLSRSPSTTVKMFEEEEKGGLITTTRHESDMKAVNSLPPRKEHKTSNQGDPFVPPMLVISSEQQASDTILPLSFIPSKSLTSPKQISMSASSQSTYGGRNVQENVGTTNNQPLQETLDSIQISTQLAECGSSEMASSICDIKNALSVVGVKEIVDMMKLEGVEPSMLVEAFKAKPQLCLSLEDRSIELLCYSYRVLLNILNILATRSPFTITDVDKRLLAKNLKDASILGFDKDWLESITIKVFNCDASEFHHKQQVLESLGNKLEANKRELANVCNQEVKAKQSIEMAQKELEATHKEFKAAYKGLEAAQSHLNVAQQEYADIRVHHSKLLEECQEILEQRGQCSEIIAAKLRPFGF